MRSLLFLTLLTSTRTWASEVFYAPQMCDPQELQVILINLSDSPLKAWLQIYKNGQIDEIEQDLSPNSKVQVSGDSFLKAPQAFSVKTPLEGQLQVLLQCAGQTDTLLSSHTSPQMSYEFPEGVQDLKLYLLNLYLESNSVTLRAFNSQGVAFAEHQVTLEKFYDTQKFKWNLPEAATRVEVIAEARLHSEVFYADHDLEQQSQSFTASPVQFSVDFSKSYFLISTREPHPRGAFAIALTDPQQIATAREQINHPELEKIVVAKVSLGSGNFNRAFMAPDKSPYSWSVSQVSNFADFAHIDCDGSPDLVEERLQQKLQGDSTICFWRYRVIKELTAFEVATGLLLQP